MGVAMVTQHRARCPVLMLAILIATAVLAGCAQQQQSARQQEVNIPANEKDPAVWGRFYPDQYDSFQRTKEGGKGESKYKGSEQLDRLSEYPYQLVLFDGFGFGVEYGEPRGHVLMMKDVLEVDPSRRKSGGICLSCKSPYA